MVRGGWTVTDDGGESEPTAPCALACGGRLERGPPTCRVIAPQSASVRLFLGVVPGGGSKTRACFLTGVVADGELRVREAFDGSRVLVEGSEAVAAEASSWQLMPMVRVASQRRAFLRVVAGDRICPREVVTGRRALDARFGAGNGGTLWPPCRPPRTAAAGRACIRVEGRLASVSDGRVAPKPSGPCGGPGWQVWHRCPGAGRRRCDCGRVVMAGHAFAWAVVTSPSRVGVSRRYCSESSARPRADGQVPGGLGCWKAPWRSS
jgi:hypothetical protein